MNNFDFESKKMNIIIFVIFIGFALLIIKAFDYLPENTDEAGKTRTADINKVLDNNAKKDEPAAQEQSQEPESQPEEPRQDNNFNVDLSRDVAPVQEEVRPVEGIEPIADVPEAVQTTRVVSDVDMKFAAAQKLKDEKQYVKAIEEYQSILEQTSEPKVKARCYEEMANVYGIVKRYGTALSYAQKAYNTYPTSSREMLLARLYYKTGDLDKATKRMNNVLQRDFASDRN